MATRRERVVLDLESNLPEGMLRGAAATEVLRKELGRLSGVSVQTSRTTANIDRDMDKMSKSSGRADKSINQLTGRLRLFADAAAILGPALAPLGGVAIAGMASLASQMGFAAVGAGVLIGSMQGLGDALSALNDAHLEPTAENLAKAETELSKLAPAAADFAREAYALLPALQGIRDAGAEALFPGLTDSLDDLERLAPVVGRIFEAVGGAAGDIAADAAASLASDRWAEFFEFIATEAPRALKELSTTVGSLAHGLAELWMAFTPLNNSATDWIADAADSFDRWASGLAQTEGFREFVDYVRTNGPLVADALGSLADAVIQIVQAAAPLGGPTLVAITALSNALAVIADSKVGTGLLALAAGMASVSRAAALMKSASALSLASFNPLMLAVGAGVGILTAWTIEAQRAAAETAAFGDSIKAMDTASLVQGLEDARQILVALDGGLGSELVAKRIGQIEAEVDAREKAAEASRRAAADHAYYNSIEAESAALEKNIGLMQAKRDQALRSFSAETNYAQSLLDSKAALEDNGRAWNLSTDAGLKNRRVVESQASAWNELNRTQGQTPAQARKARAALEDTAMSLGATKEEARRYAKQLLDIPNDLKTKIALDVDTAIQRAKAIKAELASIDRNIDVYVNVRRPNAGGFGPQVGGSADGGTIPKTGKPYADRHLYLLADGEEVISNRYGQADRHRALLKAINGGLADGGTSGKKRRAVGGLFVNDNTAALEEAIRRLTDVQEQQTAAVEAETANRDKWASLAQQAGQNTLSGFGLDLFGGSSNPWAPGSGSGALFNLDKQIAGLTERIGLQDQLAGLGLTGNALSELLKGSNADIAGMISRGEIGGYATRFSQYESLSAQASQSAGQYAFGAELAAAEAGRTLALAEAQKTTTQLVNANAHLQRVVEAVQESAAQFADQLNDASATGRRTRVARGGPR